MTSGTDVTFSPLLLLVVVGVAWYAVNRAVFNDILSPLSLLFVSWVAPLLLQASNLSAFEESWRVGPALVVAWTTVALTGTCLLAGAAVRGGGRDPRARRTFEALLGICRDRSFLSAFFTLYAVSFVAYLYAEFITNPGGVPLLAVLEGRWLGGAFHRWGKDTRWSVITGLLPLLTAMAYMAYRVNGRGTIRGMLLLTTALFPVMSVLKLSRSDLFGSAIGVVAVALILREFTGTVHARRTPTAKLVLVGVLVVAVSYMMMAIRIASIPVEDIYAGMIGFRLFEDGSMRGVAAAIYGYMAMPFDNLNRFLSAHDGSYHLGISVLRPILSISGLGDVADQIDAAVYYPAPASFAAGSATFLTAVYAELGLVGAAAIPIVYASMVNVIYLQMRARPTFGNVFLYVNFMTPWLWLFFNNGFGVLSLYLNGAFVYGIGLLGSELAAGRRTAVPAALSG